MPASATATEKPKSKAGQVREERAEAIKRLREWLPEGSTVYCLLRHRARSGMFRRISLLGIKGNEPFWLDGNAAAALDKHTDPRGDREGLPMSGCGMDMGFALVDDLSYALYGKAGALQHRWL